MPAAIESLEEVVDEVPEQAVSVGVTLASLRVQGVIKGLPALQVIAQVSAVMICCRGRARSPDNSNSEVQ